MTESQAIEGILEQWKSAWETLHPASTSDPQCVPWTTRNESFAPDALGALGAWARVAIIHTSAIQTSQGKTTTRKWERRGNVFVQLFAPVNAGVALLATLAGDVRSVLEGAAIVYAGGTVNTYGGRTQEGDEDSQWAQSTVVVPFRYVETR